MTIWRWAVCGVVVEGIVQRFTYEFGVDRGTTWWDAAGRAGKAAIMFGVFAAYGHLWNL